MRRTLTFGVAQLFVKSSVFRDVMQKGAKSPKTPKVNQALLRQINTDKRQLTQTPTPTNAN